MAKEQAQMQEKSSLVKELMAEATEEVDQELMAAYKKEIKAKLIQYRNAQKVVANIGREIEDLELKIRDELGE